MKPGLEDVRERVLAKPESVQVVLKMCMTKLALADAGEPDFERYAGQALAWWEAEVAELRRNLQGKGLHEEPDEVRLAAMIIEKSRSAPDSVWGRILRRGTN